MGRHICFISVDCEPELTLPPVSRRGGPQTSKQAEAQISDTRRSQIERIVNFLSTLRVQIDGGATSYHVALACGITNEQAKKRLSDCKNMGLAYQDGTVKVGRYSRGLWHASDGQLPLKPKRTKHCPGCVCKEIER